MDPNNLFAPSGHHAAHSTHVSGSSVSDSMSSKSVNLMPQPVVRVLSPRGVEYVFLTIALLTGAFALGGVLIALVNGKTDFSVLEFPIAVLIVALPTFAWLFLRLKKAELKSPDARFDASKRRSTQFIQIVNFLTVFFTLIGFASVIMATIGGQYNGSLVKVFLDILVVIVISGSMLVYYWRDEHRGM